MKALVAAALLAAFASMPASAQDASRGDVFAGYSMLASDGEAMHGWQAALGWGLSGPVGLLFDVSGHMGTDADGTDLTLLSAMAGPRAAFGSGRLRPFVHAMAGVVRSRASVSVFGVDISESSADWGGAAGGGLDVSFRDRWAVRLAADYRAVRVEGETVGDPRLSAGVAYRFGR